MDLIFVLEKVMGWLIPVICAAILALILRPVKKAQNAQERGQELIDQETWDRRAAALVERIEKLEENHAKDKSDIISEIQIINQHDIVVDDKLEQILKVLIANAETSAARFDAMDEKNTAAFLQIYQRDLIVDGKTYIGAKNITPQQLANYEKRYKQYKDWGGNGDVEPWIKKIRELPIHFPTIAEYE